MSLNLDKVHFVIFASILKHVYHYLHLILLLVIKDFYFKVLNEIFNKYIYFHIFMNICIGCIHRIDTMHS